MQGFTTKGEKKVSSAGGGATGDFKADGSVPMTGPLQMGGKDILGAGSVSLAVVGAVGDYVVPAEGVTTVVESVSGTLTLPDATTCAGKIVVVKNISNGGGAPGDVLVIDAGGAPVEGVSSFVGFAVPMGNCSAIFQSDGNEWNVIAAWAGAF